MSTDEKVLEALRKVAANGAASSINGDAVKLATATEDACVYMLVAKALEEMGVVKVDLSSFYSVLQQFKALRDAMRRLADANKLYRDGSSEEDAYWVVMS